MDEVAAKLDFPDRKNRLLEIMSLPFLMSNDKLHLPRFIAHKQTARGLYFTGVNYDNFLTFLHYFHSTPPFILQIQHYKNRMKHLQMDIGFDVKVENGKAILQKPAFYGTF